MASSIPAMNSTQTSLSKAERAALHETEKALSYKYRRNFFMEFVDPDIEARFIDYRYQPTGLYLPCICAICLGFLHFSVTTLNYQADIKSDTPDKWSSTSGGTLSRIDYYNTTPFYVFIYTSSALAAFVGVAAMLWKLVAKPERIAGRLLERLWVFCAVSLASQISGLDFVLREMCSPGVYSVLLRDPYVPEKCDDFLRPTQFLFLTAAIFPSRLRLLLPSIYVWIMVPFFLRTTYFDLPDLFYGSDVVWIVSYLVLVVAFVAGETIVRRQFMQHEVLQHEIEENQRAQQAANRLLVAMLPGSVLKRLIARESVNDSGTVSVVFSDVASFTAWCSAQKAQAVVSMLNTMYTLFDSGLRPFGVEKVKTVGDAYWAVCGLPNTDEQHALRICAFAKYMLSSVHEMNAASSHNLMRRATVDSQLSNHDDGLLRIRVGVATGFACGGLVGTHQAAYDMFGTTNEVAETMEQQAPVGEVLISEPTLCELQEERHGLEVDVRESSTQQQQQHGSTSTARCVVELHDAEIATAQGAMRGYVLRDFLWSPGLSDAQLEADMKLKEMLGRREDAAEDSVMLEDASPHESPRTDHLDRTSAFPLVELEETMDIDYQQMQPLLMRRMSAALEAPPSPEKADESSSMSPSSDTDAKKPDNKSSYDRVSLEQARETISKSSGHFHRFDDPTIEKEFQEFMDDLFPSKLRTISTMIMILVVTIYVMTLTDSTQPWYTHFLLLLVIVMSALQSFPQVLLFRKDKPPLQVAPLVGLALIYVQWNFVLIALACGHRSMTTIDLLYLPINFTVLSPLLGYIGGGVPYLFLGLLHMLFTLLPELIIQLVYKTVYAYQLNLFGFILVGLIALRRNEKNHRQQFIDKKIVNHALTKTRAEHENVSVLLGRMVPEFIRAELTLWYCGPRTTMFAANFPMVGILFVRFMNGDETQEQNDGTTLSLMEAARERATLCDEVLSASNGFSECTKLKMIGDVVMFGSGLRQHNKLQAEQKDSMGDSNSSWSRSEDSFYFFSNGRIPGSMRSSAGGTSAVRFSLGDIKVKAPSPSSRKSAWDDRLAPQISGVQHAVSFSNQEQLVSEDDHDEVQIDRDTQAHVQELCVLACALAHKASNARPVAGLHCGPCTAGIIGNDRLIYDVFGDTVNMASRVMSTSINDGGVWASKKVKAILSSERQSLDEKEKSTSPPTTSFGRERLRSMKGKGNVEVFEVLCDDAEENS